MKAADVTNGASKATDDNAEEAAEQHHPKHDAGRHRRRWKKPLQCQHTEIQAPTNVLLSDRLNPHLARSLIARLALRQSLNPDFPARMRLALLRNTSPCQDGERMAS